MKGLMLTLRWVALTGILASIASLEYMAGEAAGWGPLRSAGVPVGIDTFAMGVLLAPRSRGWDRVGALGLMEFTVVVSAVAGHHETSSDGRQPNLVLGAVLATALVFALWRLDETIRADKLEDDRLADALTRITGMERETAAAARRLDEERAAHAVEMERLKVAVREDAPERAATSRPESTVGVVPDDELDHIIRVTLDAKPGAGFPAVAQAIRDKGWLVGNTERVKAALRAQKQPGLRVVAGRTARGL